jgi:hypothetical protein
MLSPPELIRGTRLLKMSLLITTLEGVVVFLGLATDPPLWQGSWMFGITRLRFAILGTTIALLAALTWLTVRAHGDRAWLEGATRLLGSAASGRNLGLLTVALYTRAMFNIVALVGPSIRTDVDAVIFLKPLFNRGQLLLAGLAALFYRRFPRLHALNLILIVAFTVFIYKAGWVQRNCSSTS